MNRSRTRRSARPLPFLAMTVVGWLCLLAGCAHEPVRVPNTVHPATLNDYPGSIAVLPFTDLTETPGIAETIRIEFYSHMSVLPFEDVELHIVDERLRRRRISTAASLSRTPVKHLGRILDCDAVLIGTVYDFRRVFAGLYSSMNVGLSVQLWDTRTARMIWSDRYTARRHEGGLPFTVFDVPMVTLRSGLNLRDAVKLHAIDEACRYLVHRIPTPPAVNPEAPEAYTLQIGAFADEYRAQNVESRFKYDGFPVFVQRDRNDQGVLHRVFLGPYRSMETVLEIQQRLREKYRTESFISRNQF
ncbi:GNA1162 family protein [Desulfococcus multivorans]|uniref:Sporulation domain-containing protein n=1 Tax=Desulfococcus multivorans DSM 2059 TaxID=1121405 RepID=S7U0H2_DESML|nr:GNA1162 family protein [Desulfococcus multivorans]AQV01084.1 hypothetical protein B2D07_10085 [Desulfococcus multivorans]EPR42926.1 Sporulation domain-containing protein [Desulfococcus multivorans DSM 2059]SJZ50565.1 hypothetical protein SAMN02745446_00726 [Desulfococcus multivorans DSM 2059]